MGTPKQLAGEIEELKEMLDDKTCFGVDLLLPQVGGSARKTNVDYTNGALPELIATSILIPKVVDCCKGRLSPLTGKQVSVVAAGGIFDHRGLAAALCMGADAVWVGTRFVACEEAGAPKRHKEGIVNA